MANILGIITAALLAVSAFLAMKNKDHYQTDVDNLTTEKAKLADTEKKLKTTIAEKTKRIEEIKNAKEEMVSLEAEKTAQERSNAELKMQSEAKTAEIDGNKQKIEEISEQTKSLGNLQELSKKMKETSEEITTIRSDLAQAETRLAHLTSQTRSTEKTVDSLSSKITALTSGRSLPSLRTRIRAIYPSWGFVTLGAGNNAGVVTNSTLEVVRNGETVAKLLVTAVESSRSSASIVPDSLSSGTSLMVGDRVVAAAPPVQQTPPPAPAAPAPAPTPASTAEAPASSDPSAPATEEPAAPATEEAVDPFSD